MNAHNLGAPNATTSAGVINGQNPLGTTGGSTQNAGETVTAAGSTAQDGPPPDENVIENTNPGGPNGPVVIQPNTNPSGSGAGSAVTKPTLTPQQQFSPEYQARLDSDPNLAKAINSLSPNGQKITNEIFNYASTHNLPSRELKENLKNSNLSDNEKTTMLNYIDVTLRLSIKEE